MKALFYLISWVVISLLPVIFLSKPGHELIGNWWYVICVFLGMFSAIIAEVLYKLYKK